MIAPAGVAVLRLADPVDARTVAGAAQAAARVARRSPRAVVVDLSTVRVGIEGLVVLVVIRRRLARQGLPVVVAGGDEVTRLLDAARLSSLYRTFPSVDAAVRAITAA
jgi:anti-anti-sigma regulatory factor